LATAALTAALAFGAVAVAGPVAKKSANPVAQNGRIVFTSTRSGSFDNEDVFVMNPDGSNPVDLTPGNTTDDYSPTFSPDGRKIAFARDVDPGAGFTAHVLRATSQSRTAPRLHRPAIKSAWWHDLLRRPRFAWEAAYVGSLLILLVLGNPSIRTKATALPEIVAGGGNHMLQETTAVISGRQAQARQSISFLGRKSETWLRQAAGLPGRTSSTLRDMAISFVRDLKLEMRADEAPRDLR
jgi:dipeptidyl aminopeptidase/acylaminoacyl peptidase